MQQTNPIRAGQTAVREHNDNRGEKQEADESDHDSISNEYESDAIESEGEDDSNLKSLHSLLQTRKTPMNDRLQHGQDER